MTVMRARWLEMGLGNGTHHCAGLELVTASKFRILDLSLMGFHRVGLNLAELIQNWKGTD